MEEKYSILRGPAESNKFPNKSLGIIFYNQMQEWQQNRVLFVETDQEVTYKMFLETTVKLAIKFKSEGIQIGDTILIVAENHWKFIATIVSGFFIGASVMLLNHDYTCNELEGFLSCSPKIIFCCDKTYNNIMTLNKKTFFPKIVVNYNESSSTTQVPSFDSFIKDTIYDQTFLPCELNTKRSVALIVTSSGTTGMPKGVELTHSNLRMTMLYATDPDLIDCNKNERTIIYLPLFHLYGTSIALTGILSGMKIVIVKKFQPEVFLSLIETQRITKLFLVPPVLVFLIQSPLIENYNISSIKDVLCGAASLTKELEGLAEKKLNLTKVRQLYGMTETSAFTTVCPKTGAPSGSSGRICPNLKLKICDHVSGRILPINEIGEIRVKGKAAMKGYLGNYAETIQAFDEENYLKSGDLGYIDSNGFLYIVDRLKEVIKCKSFQVAPSELESLILLHPSVKDVGVVGKADERFGEVPVAFVVTQPNEHITEQDLITYVAENISIQKHLYGGVKFIEEIPKSQSGKILRRKLKELL